MKLSEINLLIKHLSKNVDLKSLRTDFYKVMIGFFIIGILYLFVTNPTEQEHKNAIKYKLMQDSYADDRIKLLLNSLGSDIVDSIYSAVIDKEIYSQNNILYSISKYKRNNDEISNGFGGNIKVKGNLYHLFQITKEACFKVRSSKEFIIGRPKLFGYLLIAEHDFPEEMNWRDGINSCADLGNGWRLPTIDELEYMYVNREKINGFSNTIYWSSSTGYQQPIGQQVWYFSFHTGEAHMYYNIASKSGIRAVKDN